MNLKISALAISLLVTACATTKTYETHTSFDEAAAKRMLEAGKNKITGSALVRQNGGGTVTCAGQQVTLIPATEYARERIRAIYSNEVSGYISAFGAKTYKFIPDVPNYQLNTKTAVCDAQGFFSFPDLADGEFFVTTWITWQVNAYVPEGGGLMKRISLKGGKTENIVLAP